MSKTRFGIAVRFTIIALAFVGAILVIAALVMQFRIRVSNEWEQYAPMRPAAAPTKHSRLVVFAPHADDETLGCGGVLALAARNGAKVRVVLITNGDGYRFAVGRAYKTIRVTPAMCIRFAYKRQQETARALSILGVPAKDLTFLGYPDRGLARLWNTYWGMDNLYTSPATRSDHSPYVNSLTPGAPYCGESLVWDIQSVLMTFKPTDVYLPHPSDNHPDHYATYCFITAAIEQLRSEHVGFARRMKVRTYLVHRGDWPTPKGDHPETRQAPPSALARAGTKWYSLRLTADAVRRKRSAIRCYKSQTALEPGFMMSFARRNEVFGSLPVRRVVRVPDGTIHVDGDPGDWWRIAPAVIDPVGDYVMAGMNKGGDVRAIYICADQHYLYIRLDCVKRLSRRVTYTFNLRGMGNSNQGSVYSVAIHPPSKCDPPGVIWAYRNNVMELALPRERFSFDRDLFVQVVTKMVKLTVDNTGWRSVEFAQ